MQTTKLRKILTFSFALVLAIGLFTSEVLADEGQVESSPATQSGLSTDIVYTKPRQTAEILRLRELYQDQVEQYSKLEREFYINKAQFQKLETLQSLEEAVKSGKEVMLVRSDVLITYFELMRASIDDTAGVELSERQRLADEMVKYINQLKEHRQKILQTNDRDGIAARADEFAELSKPFETTAYQALAQIRIGDIQTVYDKSLIIYQDVLKYHTDHPTSPLKQEERERAYKQVDIAIEKVRGDLRKVRTEYSEESGLDRSRYNSAFAKSLNTAYSGTSQIIFYLKELFVELT